MPIAQILIIAGAATFALLLLLLLIGLWVRTLRKPMGKGRDEDHKSGTADSHDKPHGGGFRLPSWILNAVAVILLVAVGTVGVLWIQAHGGISYILAATQTNTTTDCSGSIYTVPLNDTSSLVINPGGRCQLTFDVVSGTVRFGNDISRIADVGPDDMVGPVKKVVTKAQALTPTAELTYMLCPLNRRIENWTCL